MKKYKFKFVALLVAVALMLPNFTGAGALVENEVDDGLLTWEEVELTAQLESQAVEAHDELVAAWTIENGEICYPENFGGYYITDNYKLAVKIVNGDEEFMNQVLSIVSNPSSVEFETTDISYSELIDLNRRMPEYASSMNHSFVYSGINIESSTVLLGVKPSKGDKVRVSSNDLPIPYYNHVSIEYVDDLPSTEVNGIEPSSASAYHDGALLGDKVESWGFAHDYGSIGAYGYYDFNGDGKLDKNSEACFATAGHIGFFAKYYATAIRVAGNIVIDQADVRDGDNYIKYVFGSSEPNIEGYYSSIGDYSFFRYQKNLSPTNVVSGTGRKITAYNAANDLGKVSVYKVGATTGLKVGKIENNDMSYAFVFDNSIPHEYADKKVIVYNMIGVKGTGFGEGGDSGGPVYTVSSSGLCLCGLFDGENVTRDMYVFTPMNIVCSGGQFEPYLG